jgi:polar amino acid transport system permease protein
MITTFGLPQFGFLLTGLQWTLALTAIALVGGGLAGLAIALARVARSPWLWRSAAGYIALFQGTPLLMQLFVVYFGLGLLGLKLPAWVAVAIGFTLNASAFLGDIWRGAGRDECGNACEGHAEPRSSGENCNRIPSCKVRQNNGTGSSAGDIWRRR